MPADDLPAPEYYPEDNHIGEPPILIAVSDEEQAARRAARYAEAEYRGSPAGWRERIAPFVTAETAVVIARFAEARGQKYGEHSDTNLVEVLEHLSGPDLGDEIELVQSAGNGGGVRWVPDRVAALVLEPARVPGAYRILTRPSKDVVGWAVRITPETFESAAGVQVDRATLESLGGAP